ncbi:putative receptor-like protein kinase At4g00960 isoform X5 [Triticum aestivum]|uniref:putative receptor-like protein kinase At4g00960 isoform X5 n=1 Tax=Triticum aestivum TaxID=4565 RepID=UPI001D017F6E|nr:putative receptor-like protein kinase At4g00960 isoform X5 [Triticum aestivum]
MADQASELEALELILTDANAEPTKLSYALIKSITTNFSQEIGLGGFGVVYLGVLRNEKVAVKKLFIEQDFSDELFVDEVNCLVRAKHNNIVRFLDYCADTQGELVKFDGRHVMAELRQRLLCFEYVPNGNLHDYIKGISHGDEWQIRYKMIKGICHGLQYLHKERITHLDLKPDNVLLDAYMEPKITDFGLSRLFDEGQSRVFTKNVPGTRGYIAPEVIDKGEISFKSDIFALGIVVSKLLVGQNNYDIENWHESLDVDCTQAKSCIQIAQSCMEADQHKRPTAEEIIKKLNEMESLGSSIYRMSQETARSTEHLAIHPLELRFLFEQNNLITCALYLRNNTDHRFAFRLVSGSPDRYFDKGLYGNIPPKSTYTLFVRMRGWQQPAPHKDEFVIQSSVMSDQELKDIGQVRADIDYCNFFSDVKEKNVHSVHEVTLQAVFELQREIINVKIIPMEKFTKIFSMDVHPTKPCRRNWFMSKKACHF